MTPVPTCHRPLRRIFAVSSNGRQDPCCDGLFGIARQLTPSTADAEDLLQDTMMKAYRSFRGFQAGTHLQAWLVRIMRNTWIDQYRHRRRLPTECLTGNVDDWEWLAYGRHGKVDHDGVDTASIRQAFGGLPEALQRALYFAYVEGLSHKEIAHIECIPLGMVMSRLHRARHRLRARLAKLEIGSSPRSSIPAPSAKLTDLAS